MKTVTINQCSECPNNRRIWIDNEDYTEKIVKTSYCEVTGDELEYMHYSGFRLSPDMAFPQNCPLPDVVQGMK